MARTGRVRTRSQIRSGTAVNMQNGVPSGVPTTRTFNDVSTCSDSHGRPVIDSDFQSTQIIGNLKLNGAVVGAPFAGTSYSTQFSEFPNTLPLGGIVDTSLAVPSDWYAQVVSRTNPSRPVVTPLTLVQDLTDLPKMLRDIGGLLMRPKRILSAKESANQYLAAQFGWLPLIRDINQLLDLQSAILKRTKELRRLYSGKGLRRRITLGEDTQSAKVTQSWASGPGAGITYSHDIKLERKMWAVIRWRPITLVPGMPNDTQLNQLARRIVSGFTPEGMAKGLWDVLPWTWLIDWFVDIGAFIGTYSNTVPATHSSSCLMNQRILTCTAGPAVANAGTSNVIHSGTYTKTVKTRIVSGSLTSGFNVPFMDTFRLSILGALFVQRFKR